jgi:hypothetical protein
MFAGIELVNLYEQGPKEYFMDWTNIIDQV